MIDENNKINQGEVYFALYGEDFDANEVTKFIGIEPSTITEIKKNKISNFKWVWKISSGKVSGELVDIYEISSALVAKLQEHKQKIIAVKQKLKLEAVLQVVLRITMDDSISTPAVGFEYEVISFLNDVGATIDIDMYRN